MKVIDLARAQRIAADRTTYAAMRDRLAGGEALTLMLGDGGKTSAIVLAPDYLAALRADLAAAFEAKVGEADAALAALGVEP